MGINPRDQGTTGGVGGGKMSREFRVKLNIEHLVSRKLEREDVSRKGGRILKSIVNIKNGKLWTSLDGTIMMD